MSIILRQGYAGAGGAPAPPPALAFDAMSQGGIAGATSLSFTHTVVAASGYAILFVTVSILDPTALNDITATVTHNGQAMTALPGSKVFDAGGRYQQTFYRLNPATGAKTIQVTTDFTANIAAVSDSWDGVNQTTPFGTVATNLGTGTTASVTVPGVTAGNFTRGTVEVFGGTANVSITPGGNNATITAQQIGASPNRMRIYATENEPDSGSVLVTYTITSKPWTVAAFEIKKA